MRDGGRADFRIEGASSFQAAGQKLFFPAVRESAVCTIVRAGGIKARETKREDLINVEKTRGGREEEVTLARGAIKFLQMNIHRIGRSLQKLVTFLPSFRFPSNPFLFHLARFARTSYFTNIESSLKCKQRRLSNEISRAYSWIRLHLWRVYITCDFSFRRRGRMHVAQFITQRWDDEKRRRQNLECAARNGTSCLNLERRTECCRKGSNDLFKDLFKYFRKFQSEQIADSYGKFGKCTEYAKIWYIKKMYV